jgi:hypothetical protein
MLHRGSALLILRSRDWTKRMEKYFRLNSGLLLLRHPILSFEVVSQDENAGLEDDAGHCRTLVP